MKTVTERQGNASNCCGKWLQFITNLNLFMLLRTAKIWGGMNASMCKSWLIFSARAGNMKINYLRGQWKGGMGSGLRERTHSICTWTSWLHLPSHRCEYLYPSMRLQCDRPCHAWLLLQTRETRNLAETKTASTLTICHLQANLKPEKLASFVGFSGCFSGSFWPSDPFPLRFSCGKLGISSSISSSALCSWHRSGRGGLWPHIIKGHGRAALATSFLEVVAVLTLNSQEPCSTAIVFRPTSDSLDSSRADCGSCGPKRTLPNYLPRLGKAVKGHQATKR